MGNQKVTKINVKEEYINLLPELDAEILKHHKDLTLEDLTHHRRVMFTAKFYLNPRGKNGI